MMLLNRQRLINVLEKESGSYFQISLKKGFLKIFESNSFFETASVIVGKSQDLETLFSVKFWVKRWFLQAFLTQDFMENVQSMRLYFATKNAMIFDQEALNRSNYILLIGSNLRYELPLINLKVKQLNKAKNLAIFSWGVASNFNYFVYNLGTNFLNLNKILKGRSLFSLLLPKDFGFWFINPQVLSPVFAEYLLDQYTRSNKYSLYLVSAYNALMNMFALNFLTKNSGISFKPTIIFNIHGDDHKINNGKEHTYVYFGSHGIRNKRPGRLCVSLRLIFLRKNLV